MLEKRGSIKNFVGRISSLFSMGLTSWLFSDDNVNRGGSLDRGGGFAVKHAAKGSNTTPLTETKPEAVPLVEQMVQDLAAHSSSEPAKPMPDARPLVGNREIER